ncbi:hypothetical protein EC968_008450 [Mortierella alpina]|nr:hypothetical protein EC968_008450 [Mortierella alpina]
MNPVIACVPPPPLIASEQARVRQKEQVYLQRLNRDRSRRRGRFYVEKSRKEVSDHDIPKVDGVLEGTGSAKEPLLWEGIEAENENEDDDLDRDDFLPSMGAFSPWKQPFRSRAAEHSQDDEKVDNDGDEDEDDDNKDLYGSKAAEKHAWNMESEPKPMVQSSDDGTAIAEDQEIDKAKLVSTAVDDDLGSEKETGRFLKVEEEGRFGTESNARDPNVRENENEIIVPQVWDADGVSQKGETGKQEYVETEEETTDGPPPALSLSGARSDKDEEEEKSGKDVSKARLDQISLLGGEAGLKWLQDQAAIRDAWTARHHNHHYHRHGQQHWTERIDRHGEVEDNGGGQAHDYEGDQEKV